MPDYKVDLGRAARTIDYEDSYGTLTFTFDVDVSPEAKKIYLDPRPKTIIQSEQTRIDIAYERTQEWLRSIGYKVETS